MSNEPTITNGAQAVLPNWRTRLREVGKEAFIREEMTRLGFWPPEEGFAEQARQAEEQLRVLYAELRVVRAELHELDRELSITDSLQAVIKEIRRKRIERVRAAREQRKEAKAKQQEAHRQQDKAWREKTLPFLGHGVSAGLKYEGGDAEKTESLGLPALATAEDVANAIGISTRTLAWLTYHRGATSVDHYSRFTIPKRKGGLRVISSPKRQLRGAQSWVLNNILTKIAVHPAAMAFRPEHSILDNAKPHVGKGVIVKIDLKDFFPSIRFGRVKGMFRYLGYNEGVATLLALLSTESVTVAATLDGERKFVRIGERHLPQGACTSPATTNILCRRMDARLTELAAAFGFVYTRYADDLIFSHESAEAPVGPLLGRIRAVIAEEGYVVNEDKTRILRPQHRQVVTGVVVNETPRISRRDMRNFRAFLKHCETEGLQTMSERLGKNALLYVAGYLSFMHMVNPEQAEKLRQKHPWLTRYQPPA